MKKITVQITDPIADTLFISLLMHSIANKQDAIVLWLSRHSHMKSQTNSKPD